MTENSFPTTMAARLAELDQARAALMSELQADGFDPDFAEPDRWSVREIAYHLYIVESRISALLKNLLSAEKRDKVSEEKLRAEWQLTSTRGSDPSVRAQAPEQTLPKEAPPFAETISMLKNSREKLLALINSTSLDELAAVSAPHPLEVIGTLTGAGWLSLIAHHEVRHTRQIRNTKKVS